MSPSESPAVSPAGSPAGSPNPRTGLSVADAWRVLEHVRWGGPPDRCPHCDTTGRCYYLRPVDGRSRRTRTGGTSNRRVWRCGACRRQFSALTGTVLAGTRLDPRIWIDVVERTATRGRVPTSGQVARDYGLTREAARRVVVLLAAASLGSAG